MKEKANLFYSVLLLHLATRELFQYFEEAQVVQLVISITFFLLLIGHQFIKKHSLKLILSSIVTILLFYKLSNTFPTSANHFYIELLISIFYVLYRTKSNIDDARATIFVNGIIGLVIFIFIGSGIQKLLAGTYLNTSFIAFQIWDSEVFAQNLRWIIPKDVARITSQSGSDPFFLQQPIGKIMTICVPFIEILAGILIAFKKTRIIGFAVCLISIIGIELIAREFLFGLLYILSAAMVLKISTFKQVSKLVFASYFMLILIHFIMPKFFFN